jgi:hypothetical protein
MVLGEDILLGKPLDLDFAEHVHGLILIVPPPNGNLAARVSPHLYPPPQGERKEGEDVS